jgi:excinuclease ABC subunit C
VSKIKNVLRKLPDNPGVYQFLDAEGKIIYIGKAKNLKNRVKSYFQKSKDKTPKLEKLVEKAEDLKWIETNSEVEALTLEANLVREHQPKFNALLRDDKHFLYFKITKEDFPQLLAVRKQARDGAKYFGPKTDSKAVRNTIQLLQKLFKIRVCNLGIEKRGDKVEVTKKTINYPCIYKHIGNCTAPCIGSVSQTAYQNQVNEVINFLSGNVQKITIELREKMQTAAADKKFELATQLRDKIQAIENSSAKQLASTPDLASRDIFGVKLDFTKAYFAVLQVRNGKLIDAKNFVVKRGESELPEILASFLTQYFSLSTSFPQEILLSEKIEEVEIFENWLQEQASKKVKILFPQKGDKSNLLKLAEKNAAAFATQNKAKFENATEKTIGACNELAKSLDIEKELKRIEAYDISHFSGDATSGSMVVFERGEPKNSDYRYFKINSLEKGKVDDCASLVEVLSRRMDYLVSQNLKIKIRKATKKQIPEIKKILKKDFAYLDTKYDEKKDEWFIALEEKRIIGGFRFVSRDKNHTELASVCVTLEKQNSGVGKALVKFAIKKTPTKKLYLLTGLLHDFYEKFGFQEVRVIPKIFETKIKRIEKKRKAELSEVSVLVKERNINEDSSFSSKPNLVILDGGKPQLSSVLKNVNFPKGVEVIGLAKREEEIFKMHPATMKFKRILLPRDSQALYLVQRIRDEAHRFANSLREKIQGKSFR